MSKKAAPKKPPEHKPCPCGETPTELMVALPQGSKHGRIEGNCCGLWSVEFRAGYPKNNEQVMAAAKAAWDSAPRA